MFILPIKNYQFKVNDYVLGQIVLRIVLKKVMLYERTRVPGTGKV